MTSTPLVGTKFFGLELTPLLQRLKGLRRQVSKRVLLLEFDPRRLRLAEARFAGAGLQFDHVSRIDLPEDALERGIPSDPAKMAGLIRELCSEKQIDVVRAAVVLPTEVAFQRLIQLPAGLSLQEARQFVLDPSSGLQIPIALSQADFDLQPTTLPGLRGAEGNQVTYLLSAMPCNLVDRVLETFQAAELELQALEIGAYSQLRLMALDLVMLREQDVRLVLELQRDCTHFILVGASGPFCMERLAAIREFPEPTLSEEQTVSALEDGVGAEQISIHQESYLALSEMDLRVLVAEMREALQRFSADWPGFHLQDIALMGPNSAHPILAELLQAEFGCFVQALEPVLAPAVEGLQYDNVVVQKGLNRLVGLGLGLLPSDHLLSCRLLDAPVAVSKTTAISLVDVTPAPEPSSFVETESLAVIESQVALPNIELEAVPGGGSSTIASSHALASDIPLQLEVEPQQDPALESEPIQEEEEEWPSIASQVFPSEPELPIAPSSEEINDDEEEWPSIGRLMFAQEATVSNIEATPEALDEPIDQDAVAQAEPERQDDASSLPLGELKFSDDS
ncbi:Pilus assembly related protein [Synechococcus sp. PROS-7-1]|uniref:type IV pilus biogenesis protein PilM n=1 Tax=Synechococcus sp. PROS-7-1 TaxID=1442556 RepID=UPI0016444CD7|nr:pilus assembly protein PilM [Synechococcus sp. PROS-7-1]QNI86428.1 Pilus assembly related protein [Synechococcus sp. PROS-7-1]